MRREGNRRILSPLAVVWFDLKDQKESDLMFGMFINLLEINYAPQPKAVIISSKLMNL